MGIKDWFRRKPSKGIIETSDTASPPVVTSLPEWAPHFKSVDDFNHFIALVRRYFARRSIPARLIDGMVIAPQPDKPNDPEAATTFGLLNVSQACTGNPREEWGALVADHFDRVERTMRLNRDDAKFKDYSWCRSRLVPRLWPLDSNPVLEHGVVRDDIPGLKSALSVDLPETVRSVLKDDVIGWPGTPDDWFTLAIETGQRLQEPTIQRLDIPCETPLLAIESPDQIAAWALGIDALPDVFGSFGAVVALPTKGVMLAMPFNSAAIAQDIPNILAIATGLYRDGPASLTPKVYHVRKGTWAEIEYEINDGQLSVTPPPEFVAALEESSADL